MESQRQKKIAQLLQEDLAEIFLRDLKAKNITGIILSVTEVKVAPDLSSAKVFVSVFPKKNQTQLLDEISAQLPKYRHELSQRTRHQLRRVPELNLQTDDSVERTEAVEKSLTQPENPILKRDLLEKRKKI